ncbi:hypothetical protein B0H66DRAFT_554072 [Apodospora peruviana]|uniref:Uncharacterized protein n=1 Tax=Apodospora peruviana TaxID=516989 RepID=A0AAE0ICS5_9PEZI|nr:hypothetical protein B0H66DRAFT_554072 [Apodospora peruviana]
MSLFKKRALDEGGRFGCTDTASLIVVTNTKNINSPDYGHATMGDLQTRGREAIPGNCKKHQTTLLTLTLMGNLALPRLHSELVNITMQRSVLAPAQMGHPKEKTEPSEGRPAIQSRRKQTFTAVCLPAGPRIATYRGKRPLPLASAFSTPKSQPSSYMQSCFECGGCYYLLDRASSREITSVAHVFPSSSVACVDDARVGAEVQGKDQADRESYKRNPADTHDSIHTSNRSTVTDCWVSKGAPPPEFPYEKQSLTPYSIPPLPSRGSGGVRGSGQKRQMSAWIVGVDIFSLCQTL